MSRTIAAAALLLAVSPSWAAPVRFELVKDLDTSVATIPTSSAPQRFRTIGGKVYFAASRPATGNELYVVDGDGAAPRLVADIAPGAASSSPTALGLAGDRLIVWADDGYTGGQLWAVDAAGAAIRLTSKSSPSYAPPPVALGNVGNRLIVGGPGSALWASDGSVAGTRSLERYGSWRAAPGCSVNGRVVALDRDIIGSRLVATDATVPNTVTLVTSPQTEQAYSASDGSYCYFALGGYRWEIWRTDGTVAGTSLWRDGEGELCAMSRFGGHVYVLAALNRLRLIDADTGTVGADLPQAVCGESHTLYVAGGRLVFVGPPAGDPAGRVLHVSDGTAAGTQPLTLPGNIYPGYPIQAAVMGQRFVFQAGFSGVYTLDTAMAAITPLPGRLVGLGNGDIATLDGAAFLSGNDETHGQEPWRSDGTPAGTGMLQDLWAASNDGLSWTDPALPAAALGARLYFVRLAPATQGGRRELWRTDGTAAGTAGIAPAAVGGNVTDVVALDHGLAFSVAGAGEAGGMAVYRADADLNLAAPLWTDASIPSLLQPIPGDGVLFDCDGSGSGNVCALAPGQSQPAIVAPALQSGRRVLRLGQLGAAALFLVSEGGSGDSRGLWRSDGTAPGTFRIAADLYVPYAGIPSAVASLVHVGQLWFLACDAVPEFCGLYVTDGSAGGTRRVAALASSSGDIEPLGSRVAVLAGDGDVQLWVSDGSEAGTQALGSFAGAARTGLAAADGRVHFVAGTAPMPVYYVSDGTASGTHAVTLPPQTRPSVAAPLALGADMVVFRCFAPALGDELCVTDAAANGVTVHDLFPGPASSSSQFLGRAGDSIYFAADDGEHGRELWRVLRLPDPIFRDGFQ